MCFWPVSRSLGATFEGLISEWRGNVSFLSEVLTLRISSCCAVSMERTFMQLGLLGERERLCFETTKNRYSITRRLIFAKNKRYFPKNKTIFSKK
jgi:hypothetical protein